jgi:hypothetical protein
VVKEASTTKETMDRVGHSPYRLFFLLDNFISIKQFFLPSIVILAGLIVIIKGIR